MGTEYVFKCSKCDYQIDIFLGVGFSFPTIYKEIVEKAKSGEFGETIKEFLLSKNLYLDSKRENLIK